MTSDLLRYQVDAFKTEDGGVACHLSTKPSHKKKIDRRQAD